MNVIPMYPARTAAPTAASLPLEVAGYCTGLMQCMPGTAHLTTVSIRVVLIRFQTVACQPIKVSTTTPPSRCCDPASTPLTRAISGSSA